MTEKEIEDAMLDNAWDDHEELLAYRAIGTVEELKTAKKYVSIAKKHGTVGKAIDSCAEYEAIGTIERFKELTEKAEPKKPIEMQPTNKLANGYSACPVCGAVVGIDDINGDYCHKCGQRLNRERKEQRWQDL